MENFQTTHQKKCLNIANVQKLQPKFLDDVFVHQGTHKLKIFDKKALENRLLRLVNRLQHGVALSQKELLLLQDNDLLCNDTEKCCLLES